MSVATDRLHEPLGMYRWSEEEHPLGPGTYNLPMCSQGRGHTRELNHRKAPPGAAPPGTTHRARTAAEQVARSSHFGSETLRFDATASQRKMATLTEQLRFHDLGPGAYHQINNLGSSHRPYQPRSNEATRVISAPLGAALSRSRRPLSDASTEFISTAPGSYDLPSAFAQRGSRRSLMMGSQHGTCSFLSSGRKQSLTPDAANFIVTPAKGLLFDGQQLGPGSYNLPMCSQGSHKREMKHSHKQLSAEHAPSEGHMGAKEDEYLHAASAAKSSHRRNRRSEAPEVHDDWVHEVRLVRDLPCDTLPPDTP